MKVLLDECLPRGLANLIQGHTCRTVTQCGWSGLTNGNLLSTAQTEFDIFLTVDQNLPNQQNLTRFSIGVLVLRSRSNDLEILKEFVPAILEALSQDTFIGAKFINALTES